MLDVTEIRQRIVRTSYEIFEKLKTNAIEIYQEGKAAAKNKKDKPLKRKQQRIKRNDSHQTDYH